MNPATPTPPARPPTLPTPRPAGPGQCRPPTPVREPAIRLP
ncbi:hypothetical protein HNQ07_004408 [Deinococcus metalli]|uniref:Uncharacterized protein n=1 Tax=Deinococcus metalli TaxID=1141878 RepID=A0A7W8KKY1_9DEIO|nr:hypothetical protein [Deinococcus metalli]